MSSLYSGVSKGSLNAIFTFLCILAKRTIGVSLDEQSAPLTVKLVNGTAGAEVQNSRSVVLCSSIFVHVVAFSRTSSAATKCSGQFK